LYYRLFSSSNSDDKDEETKEKETTTVTTASPVVQVPFGESAPRFPHSLVLPIVSRPLFPGLLTSVTVSDPSTMQALSELHEKDEAATYLSCFLRKESATVPEIITNVSDIYTTGTFCQVQKLGEPGDNMTLTLLAHRRVDLQQVDDLGPPVQASISHWPLLEVPTADDTLRALSNEVISTIRQVAALNPLFREGLTVVPLRFDANDPLRLADFAASICTASDAATHQAILASRDAHERLQLALELLNREKQVSLLQQEISSQVEERLTDAQRKYFLQEQLRAIKKELGMEQDDKDVLLSKYRDMLTKYPSVPDEAMAVITAELDKFGTLERNSPEYTTTRSYLDWLTGVPWNVVTDEILDLQRAQQVLDRDHYGLDDVKQAILQFLAVGQLQGSVRGKVLLLHGPPGTGKTSVAQSIASALGRKFYRISVGGLSDVSEIKGHRRTYIGAMPGKIVQCLKSVGTCNPVVLVDEIDKLGNGFRGDPASALLEVLDPSQNSNFRDHFLDVPVDISQILFVCTANDLDRIPAPLLDRMEVIPLSGYDGPEKVAIAEQYLVPKSMKDSGLMLDPNEKKEEETKKEEGDDKKQDKSDDETAETESVSSDDSSLETKSTTPLDTYIYAPNIPETLRITKDAIQSLVRWYAREAGVRNLAKYIDQITRKLALQIVSNDDENILGAKNVRKSDTWVISKDNLADYVGKPIFTSDRLYQEGTLPNGIVMGLAYTSMGGSALYIETQGVHRSKDEDGKTRRGGGLKVTGQLGDVMKESSEIAYTVARSILLAKDLSDNDYFDVTDIHMHVPEGATPKDGPSAGITMVTSMLSLALQRPIRNDLAMTGEVSLTGKVLPVGGIKEKIMAARRAGITTVVLPAANERDFGEIPEYLKEGLTVHYAEEYEQVYKVAFAEE